MLTEDTRGLRLLSGALRKCLKPEHRGAKWNARVAYEWFVRLAALRCVDAGRRPRDGRDAIELMEPGAEVLPEMLGDSARVLRATARRDAVGEAIGLLWGSDERELVDVCALGWLHQFWMTADKAKVSAKLKRKQGDKVAGEDLLAATCIYTGRQIVRFLLHNSLGAAWMAMRPRTKLRWELLVPGAAAASPAARSLSELTLIDPACGAGHFLVEAFDMLCAMWEEEGVTGAVACERVLSLNLYGLDIDPRAVRLCRTAIRLKCLRSGVRVGGMNVACAEKRLGALARPGRGRALPPAPSLTEGGQEIGATEVLSRRYDIVATNPPYVGFRKLAAPIRAYVMKHDPLAASDLAVAFIGRCHELLAEGGRLAVVSPATWMSSRPAAALRRHMVSEGGPVVVGSLGQRVFETAPLLFVSVALIEKGNVGDDRPVMMLPVSRAGELMSGVVAGATAAMMLGAVRRSRDAAFVGGGVAPGVAAAYRSVPAGELFTFVDGLWSGDNARDVREFHEVEPGDPEWVPASGGQGYRRWYAPVSRRMRASVVGEWPVLEQRIGSLEYARVAGGKLAARLVRSRSAAIAGVVTMVAREKDAGVRALAVFNSRLGTYWLRTLVSGLNFNPGYAARVPIPADPLPRELQKLVMRAVSIQERIAAGNPLCDDFGGDRFEARTAADWIEAACSARLSLQRDLLRTEAKIESGLLEFLGVDAKVVEGIVLPPMSELERARGEVTARVVEKVRREVARELVAQYSRSAARVIRERFADADQVLGAALGCRLERALQRC